MNIDALVPALVFIAFAAVGWRATYRTFRTYRDIRSMLQPVERLIGQAFVVVCFIISATATVFGGLSTRTLLGFERFEWAPVLGWIAALAIFTIPPYLEYVQNRLGGAESLRPAWLGRLLGRLR